MQDTTTTLLESVLSRWRAWHEPEALLAPQQARALFEDTRAVWAALPVDSPERQELREAVGDLVDLED